MISKHVANDFIIKSIGIYLLVCYGLYQIKHPKMFDENKEFKNFGLNENETLLNYASFIILKRVCTCYRGEFNY